MVGTVLNWVRRGVPKKKIWLVLSATNCIFWWFEGTQGFFLKNTRYSNFEVFGYAPGTVYGEELANAKHIVNSKPLMSSLRRSYVTIQDTQKHYARTNKDELFSNASCKLSLQQLFDKPL